MMLDSDSHSSYNQALQKGYKELKREGEREGGRVRVRVRKKREEYQIKVIR